MHAMVLSRRNSPLALPIYVHGKIYRSGNQKRKTRLKNLNSRMRRLKSDMEEISEEQRRIKEGQRQVRENFEAIELECDQLRKETDLIMQQSVSTQIRLAFMFQILKARENQEFDKAAKLTCGLRELVRREKQEKNASAPVFVN